MASLVRQPIAPIVFSGTPPPIFHSINTPKSYPPPSHVACIPWGEAEGRGERSAPCQNQSQPQRPYRVMPYRNFADTPDRQQREGLPLRNPVS